MCWGVKESVASAAFERLNQSNFKDRSNTSSTTSLGKLIHNKIALTISLFVLFYFLSLVIILTFVSLVLVTTLGTTNTISLPLSCLYFLNDSRPLFIPSFHMAKADRFINVHTIGINPRSEILAVYSSSRFASI